MKRELQPFARCMVPTATAPDTLEALRGRRRG